MPECSAYPHRKSFREHLTGQLAASLYGNMSNIAEMTWRAAAHLVDSVWNLSLGEGLSTRSEIAEHMLVDVCML